MTKISLEQLLKIANHMIYSVEKELVKKKENEDKFQCNNTLDNLFCARKELRNITNKELTELDKKCSHLEQKIEYENTLREVLEKETDFNQTERLW